MAHLRLVIALALSSVTGCGDALLTPEPLPDAAVADGDGSCALQWATEIERWSSCMDFATWESVGMGFVSHQVTEGGPCYQCHHSGLGANYMVVDSAETFYWMRQVPFISVLVGAEYSEPDGCLAGLVPSRRLLERDTTSDGVRHPRFTWDPDNREAIADFIAATHAAYEAGGCL